MRNVFVLFVIASLAACASTPAPTAAASTGGSPVDSMPLPPGEFSFAGGDGTSMEKAVVVIAENTKVGVPAEYAWIGRHFPGAEATGTSLLRDKDRTYDTIDIVTKTGERRTIYFDISNFFGKY